MLDALSLSHPERSVRCSAERFLCVSLSSLDCYVMGEEQGMPGWPFRSRIFLRKKVIFP